jgi:glucose uptake protein GlcU
MLGTAKWPKFVKEFGEIMEETIDDKAMEDLKEMNDESGWVQALIAAIGAIGSSSLSLAASSKQQKAAKENAKAQMFSGVSAALAEKQKLEAEKEKTRREGKRATVWIVVTIIIVFAAIIGIVIYKRRKAKGTGE